MKTASKRNGSFGNIIAVLGLASLIGLSFGHAQQTSTTTQGDTTSSNGTNVDWSSLSDAQIELMAIEQIPPIPYAQLSERDMEGGTFWSAQHSPLSPEEWPPLPPGMMKLPVWSLGTNIEGYGVFLLDDTNVDYTALAQSNTASGVLAMDEGSSGGFSPDFSFPSNALWLQINDVTNGLVYLTLNGTTNGVQYQILSQDALSNAPMSSWNLEGSPFWGSDTTNWTITTVTQNGRSNLFMIARSLISSDGNGVPDWWEMLYYGHTGIDVNALDSANDGWTIYQKFIMGVAPNTFVTPPTPQGVTVSYNPASGTATVSWQPSPGPVANYTVNFNGTDYPVSAAANTLTKAMSLTPYNVAYYGPSVFTSFEVQANYNGGSSPQGSTALEPDYPNEVSVIAASQDSSDLTVLSLPPAGTTAIRLSRIDYYAEQTYGNSSFDTNWDIPLSSFTDGLYSIPAYMQATPVDGYGQANYAWWVQTVGTNGVANSLANQMYFTQQPFYDGRAQLKQNLSFLLRAASQNQPFNFEEYSTNGFYPNGYYNNGYISYDFTNPPDFAWAGLDQADGTYEGSSPDFSLYIFGPFNDNYRYLNFVENAANLDNNGYLTTGATLDFSGALELLNPTWQISYPPTAYQITNSVLSASQTRWLYSKWEEDSGNVLTQSFPNYSMASNARNLYGLPFLSAEIVYENNGSVATTTLSAGGNVTLPAGASVQGIYMETAQPQFQTMEYDFWNPPYTSSPLPANRDLVPGMPGFSTTNTSRLMIVGLGNSGPQISGYAKLAVTNGYPGVYAYLGQYFDQAYQIDNNGNVTTNTTGVLSSYGNFFPTEPGPAALVTMPDPDTGTRGTCTVYAISINVDANHDGVMDTSFSGPDTTSPNQPMVMWTDANYDRTNYDTDDSTNYEDDVDTTAPGAVSPLTGKPTPDYDYRSGSGAREIPTKRDLEDFARLWVCGVTSNLLTALPLNSTVTLSWGDVNNPNTNNPTIDLFLAADPDGGIGYLTNETIAAEQTNNVLYPNVTRLGPGSSLTLNGWQFTNGWVGSHFIWCGVAPGSGQLTLTIADGNGTILVQASQWIQIVDIKQMYERWTVGDNPTNAPYSVAEPVSEGLAAGVPAFQYSSPTGTNTPYILFVHGWNMDSYDKDRFAETAFKRLYWQGYQGRFGEFRWPTRYGFNGVSDIFTNLPEKDNFDDSEYTAWQSGTGLLNLLTNLNAEYPGQVYMLAHSLGNVVAGEALRLAGNNQVVNTYVASQAAVTAHTYDTNVPNYSFNRIINGFPLSFGPYAPNIYGNWFAGNNGGSTGRVISFYNTNDFALALLGWQVDQLTKPDSLVAEGSAIWDYGYNGSTNDPPPWNNFYKTNDNTGFRVNFDIVNTLTNRYEVMAYAAQAYTTALGATPDVTNLASLNLTTIWPSDPTGKAYTEHFWHSAEFRGDNALAWAYWNTLLFSPTLGFNFSKP